MPPNSKLVVKNGETTITRETKITERGGIVINGIFPKKRQELIKWNGWGFKDSGFVTVTHNGKTTAKFTGNRYPIGETILPYFGQWVMDKLGINLDSYIPYLEAPPKNKYPPPNISQADLKELKCLGIQYTLEVTERMYRAHGQNLNNIMSLKRSALKKLPDVVVWPSCHRDVERIVEFADGNNMVIIPVGGNTSVTGSTDCPHEEQRTVICLDTTQMNNILWIDEENLTACCESGITGQDLEKALSSRGYTCGHEPDSYELSTLGGWVATRASGMKKNVYGNIEDIVIHAKLVSPRGVLDKNVRAPRISSGPDFNHIILGSEGTLGVITEVIIKIRPVPELQKYGSIMFPTFEAGFKMIREVAEKRCQPSSIRLVDNEQFQIGYALRKEPSFLEDWLNYCKKLYITKVKGFDVAKIAVATLLFEGSCEEVAEQERKINELAAKHGGIITGEETGRRGYLMTFVIAYVRDIALDFNIICESFETSAPWGKALAVASNTKHRVQQECKKRGISHCIIGSRITQTYDAGCAIYFYFAYTAGPNLADPVHVFEEIEGCARDEILASGGTISHHHGVGKARRKWYPQTVSRTGLDLFEAAKDKLDPKNVFANGNLYVKGT